MKKLRPEVVVINCFILLGVDLSIKSFIYPMLSKVSGDPLLGLFFMFLFSIVLRSILLFFYYYTNTDRFAIENLKEKRERVVSNLVTRKITWLKKFGPLALFLALVALDPFVTAIYYRKNNLELKGFPARYIWLIFLLSNIIGVAIVGSGFNIYHYGHAI